MQNVPVRTPRGRDIRAGFESAPGDVLTSPDYCQVELRVLAHVADEPVLKEIFLRGEDVHTATASQVFGRAPEDLTPMDRSKAKDRKSTRLNSSHANISYAVFCLKKKTKKQ